MFTSFWRITFARKHQELTFDDSYRWISLLGSRGQFRRGKSVHVRGVRQSFTAGSRATGSLTVRGPGGGLTLPLHRDLTQHSWAPGCLLCGLWKCLMWCVAASEEGELFHSLTPNKRALLSPFDFSFTLYLRKRKHIKGEKIIKQEQKARQLRHKRTERIIISVVRVVHPITLSLLNLKWLITSLDYLIYLYPHADPGEDLSWYSS